MKYLIKTTEMWRVDSENEAKMLIEESKKEKTSFLLKYASERKERRAQGEIVDSWYRVTLTKVFQDEKEPEGYVTVDYNRENYYPTSVEEEE